MPALAISPGAFIAAASCIVLLYSLFLAIYRLFFHPLASFPGPKLAALTKWYEFYFDILKGHGGQYAFEIKRLHGIYGTYNYEQIGTTPSHLTGPPGPIIRINPEEIHVDDPIWHATLYASNPTRRDKWPPSAKQSGVPLASMLRQSPVFTLTDNCKQPMGPSIMMFIESGEQPTAACMQSVRSHMQKA